MLKFEFVGVPQSNPCMDFHQIFRICLPLELIRFRGISDNWCHGNTFKIFGSYILLRKIALPYPHKCLLGFVEAKRGDQQEYLKIILVQEVNPVVSDRCACAQHIVGRTLSRDPHSIFGRRGGNT